LCFKILMICLYELLDLLQSEAMAVPLLADCATAAGR